MSHADNCPDCYLLGQSTFTSPDESIIITVAQAHRAIEKYWVVIAVAGHVFKVHAKPVPWIVKRSVMLGCLGTALGWDPAKTLSQSEDNPYFIELADHIVTTAESIARMEKAELS